MTTWNNQSKSTGAWANSSKNTSIWYDPMKYGDGWHYDEINVKYNGPTDPNNGRTLYYNSEAVPLSWTNQNKS